MKTVCKRCCSEIKDLNFSEEQKLEIWGLINQNLKLSAVKKLIDNYQLSHKESKIIVAHLNKDFGKCHGCNFEDLTEENIECPKCKAFNYNLKINPSFNKEFCIHLEWRLDFENLDDDRLNGFWCDGVDHIPTNIMSLSKFKIKEHKEIITTAWIGKDGQSIYEMTIKLGNRSLKNYELNQSLIDCISDNNYKTWIKIDPVKKKIEINLK